MTHLNVVSVSRKYHSMWSPMWLNAVIPMPRLANCALTRSESSRVGNITAMGQSCGGLEAIDASSDPRVDSTILWNSGIFAGGGIGGVGKEALRELHAPVAWLNGGPSDIAYSNAQDDYERVPNSVPSVFGAYGDVGHMAMFTDPAIEREIIDVAADWLDATLYDNAQARAQFVGQNCGLCSGTEWEMESKNWP